MKIVFMAFMLLGVVGVLLGAWSVLEDELRSGLISIFLGGMVLQDAQRRWRKTRDHEEGGHDV